MHSVTDRRSDRRTDDMTMPIKSKAVQKTNDMEIVKYCRWGTWGRGLFDYTQIESWQ